MLQLEKVLYYLHGNIQDLSHIPTKHAIDNNKIKLCYTRPSTFNIKCGCYTSEHLIAYTIILLTLMLAS